MLVVLPKNLTAHTPAKASEVMADFNALVTAVNGQLDQENLAESIRNALLPVATILATGASGAPSGFLMCEGQEVSRTTYAVLFAAIGTLYGAGNGTTTFNLPDLRGRVPMGVDGGAGRISFVPDALGQSGGAEQHTLIGSEIPGHTHSIEGSESSAGVGGSLSPHSHNMGVFAGTLNVGEGFKTEVMQPGGSDHTATDGEHVHELHGSTGENKGGGNSHTNMQPYQVFHYMIKT